MADYKKDTVSEYQDSEHIEKKGTKNITARICSVVLAVILWFYVMKVDSPTYEKTFDYVPITLSGTQEILETSGLSVISGHDGVVDVTLSGKQSTVNKLKTSDIVASVDISSVTMSGKHLLPVNITTKSGIKVISYKPTTLEVYVDLTMQKDIQIRPHVAYSKEENVVLGEYATQPSMIKVSGPAEIIENIAYATAEADFGKITKSMSGVGRIKLYDTSDSLVTNPYVKTNVNSVNISVPVFKKKVITPVIKFSDNVIPQEYINVKMSRKNLTVQGESEYIDSLGEEMVVAVVDPKQITEKSTIEVLLPGVDSNLEYLDGETLNIDIDIAQSVLKNRRIIPLILNEANIEVKGIEKATGCRIKSPATIYIEARSAYPERLTDLTADKITIQADLSTVKVSGEYRRDVIVVFDDPKIYTSGEYNITFEVIY